MLKRHIFAFGVLSALSLITHFKCSALENNPIFKSQSLNQSTTQEKPQLLLYYNPWCPYCQKVLDYLNQIHKTVPMKNLQSDLKYKEELKKIGGKTQVPCLIINGKAMYESADIIRWLSQNKSTLDPS